MIFAFLPDEVGTHCAKQDLVCVCGPGHTVSSGTQSLSRVWFPPPQGTEHLLQEPHTDHSPTESRLKEKGRDETCRSIFVQSETSDTQGLS